jgi:hypothetical protein
MQRRRRATPRRPLQRRINARTSGTRSSPRTSASATALRSPQGGKTPARSSSVRATVVQGIPFNSVQSDSRSAPSRWAAMAAGIRPRRFAAVTSTFPGTGSISPQCSAAERCDSTAPPPHAKTAAMKHPSRLSKACPTAYTPELMRCRRPCSARFRIALALMPAPTNCACVTKPCWASATRAIRQSLDADGPEPCRYVTTEARRPLLVGMGRGWRSWARGWRVECGDWVPGLARHMRGARRLPGPSETALAC